MDTKEEYEKQIKIADDWVQKALATKKIKAEKKAAADARRYRRRAQQVASFPRLPKGRAERSALFAYMPLCLPCANTRGAMTTLSCKRAFTLPLPDVAGG